jgi:hypothetical protein
MAVATLTCPFCNALVDVASAGGKIVCPRCGESFTPRSDTVTAEAPAPSAEAVTAAAPTGFPPKPVGRNRVVGGIILAVMLLMAGAGLTLALLTQARRRSHDTGLPRKNTAPLDDAALLGYLPKDTNVVAGLNWEQLNRSEAGRDFLKRKVSLGKTEVTLNQLPDWLGLRSEDVRLVIVGLVVAPGQLAPELVVLVRTRSPINVADHRAQLHNPRPFTSGQREMTEFDLPGMPGNLPGYLIYVDDHTLACSLFASNLEGVPAQPAQDFKNLAPDLTDVLRHHVDLTSPVWLAGASDDWSKTPANVLVKRKPQEQPNPLAGMRRFGVSVGWSDPDNAGAPILLRSALLCRDEAAAQDVEIWLGGWWKMPPNSRIEREGAWVRYQRRIPLQDVRLPTER